MERTRAPLPVPSACTYPATYAKIWSPVLQTVSLPLIASVFYHDALLSPPRSLGSCQKGLLSASGENAVQRLSAHRTGQGFTDRETEGGGGAEVLYSLY